MKTLKSLEKASEKKLSTHIQARDGKSLTVKISFMWKLFNFGLLEFLLNQL